MNEFIFRFPKDTPPLNYRGLDAYLGEYDGKAIGTTVMVERHVSSGKRCIAVELYGTLLAYLYEDRSVYFFGAGANDRHTATGRWLDLIARDALGGSIWQEKWVRKLVGHPESGPIAGRTFHPAATAIT
jgi:hypothetical protein